MIMRMAIGRLIRRSAFTITAVVWLVSVSGLSLAFAGFDMGWKPTFDGYVGINSGVLVLEANPNYGRYGYTLAHARMRGPRIDLREEPLQWLTFDAWLWGVTIPLWTLLLASTIPGSITVVRWSRRKSSPSCRNCGYSLLGLPPDSKCPECGENHPLRTRR